MRIGQNPAKFVKEVARPERITVAVLNYIPFLSGFYAETLEVLKVCLESIWQTADLPLRSAGVRQRQLRRGARIPAGRAAGRAHPVPDPFREEPGQGRGLEHDLWRRRRVRSSPTPTATPIFTRAGCLARVQLLETYPKVGMVTAARSAPKKTFTPAPWNGPRRPPGWRSSRASSSPGRPSGNSISAWGRARRRSAQHYEATQDVRLTYAGVQAFAGASHWQFVARKDGAAAVPALQHGPARWGRSSSSTSA